MPAPGLLAAGPILIHILTFNIWGLPDVGFRIISPLRVERTAEICKELRRKSVQPQGWDVVMLQEVWTLEGRETLKHCGYKYSAEREDSRLILDSGLMILSKYPLERVSRLTYPPLGNMNLALQDGEAFAHKSALIARVIHPRAAFWVATTHLISIYSKDNDTYAGMRRLQFNQLSSWAREISGSEPLIIGGDFNFGPENPLWKEVPQTLVNLKQSLGAEEQCTLCPPNMMHLQNEGKVDHLFATSHFAPVSGQTAMTSVFKIGNTEIGLSDHFGWENTFRFF